MPAALTLGRDRHSLCQGGDRHSGLAPEHALLAVGREAGAAGHVMLLALAVSCAARVAAQQQKHQDSCMCRPHPPVPHPANPLLHPQYPIRGNAHEHLQRTSREREVGNQLSSECWCPQAAARWCPCAACCPYTAPHMDALHAGRLPVLLGPPVAGAVRSHTPTCASSAASSSIWCADRA